MYDFIDVSVAALLIFLGSIGIFLWLGGKYKDLVLPENVSSKKRNLVGFGGGIFLLMGLVFAFLPLLGALLLKDSGTPEPLSELVPTNTSQVVATISEATNIATAVPTIVSPEPLIEPTETETADPVTNTPESFPEPTNTETAVPPTNTAIPPTDTAVPPTNTAVPPTNTAVPPTDTAVPQSDEIVQVISAGGDNWVYAGPGTVNARLGAMQPNEKGIVLGKNKWDDWIKVETEREVTGWVELEMVEFVTGELAEVPVVWPLTTSSVATSPTTSGGSQCLNVTLSSQDWPSKEFDDIWIHWANVPDNTSMIRIQVDGIVNGESQPLIYPTLSDLETDEYYIGYWKFIERGFSTGVTFSYTVSAIDAGSQIICTVTSQFNQ